MKRQAKLLVTHARALATREPALSMGLLVFALALAVRLPDLGASCNVDSVLYWFARTRKFWAALAEHRFSETYFSPHPGVSIMWLSGAAMRLTGTLDGPVTERTLVAATTPLAVLASVVPAATVPLVFRALTSDVDATAGGLRWSGQPAVARQALWVSSLMGVLLATEPFLVAHARTFQLDATATGFVWLGVLLGLTALFERHFGWAVASGVCFGIAMLTRMLSGTFIVGLGLAFAIVFTLERGRAFRLPLLVGVVGASALLTAFLLWPALLTNPAETFHQILQGTVQTIDRGHVVLSWGNIYRRDPGPAFYGGVILMRLSEEVLGLALLGLLLAWRWPRRTLAVLAVLACAYVPPALGLLSSAKKGDRYVLLYFPIIIFICAAGLVDLVRRLRLPPSLARRSLLVSGTLATLFLAARILRLASVHPLPITWCASYPGLRCEEVITLGQGEGFREAALWISEHTPVKNPRILSAYAGGAVLSPWLRFQRVRDGSKAHFIVTYIASDQRRQDTGVAKYAIGDPVHEVRYQDRTYVRIFLGLKHPDATHRRGRATKAR